MFVSELEKNIRNWNANTSRVNNLVSLFSTYNGNIGDNDQLWNAICKLDWADNHLNLVCGAVSEFFCILSIDFEGNCLLCDTDIEKNTENWYTQSYAELETVYKNWIEEQKSA